MKNIIIGLVVLSSISAFAQTPKVVCGSGANDSDESLKVAVEKAERNLNSKLSELSKVMRTSAPTIQILNDDKFRNQDVAICVTVELKYH